MKEAKKFSESIKEKAFDAMSSAVEMERRGRNDVALTKIKMAIQSDPSVPIFHVLKGEVLNREYLDDI